MKCLPACKVPTANGTILHDWHAEVLAMRAFNHFLLSECRALLSEGIHSPYVHLRTIRDADDVDDAGEDEDEDRRRQQPPFLWNDSVSLHMYCSEAPCGDASMELTISAQGVDAVPWEAPLPPHLMERNSHLLAEHSSGSRVVSPRLSSAPSPDFPPASLDAPSATTIATTNPTPALLLLGRACFSHLGVVRRKPARPDAPPTLSKSCSDKLALRQCTSLLSSVTSLLVSPRGGVYLSSLVVPASQFSETAVERCFSPRGRMAGVQEGAGRDGEGRRRRRRRSRWQGGYVFWPFEVRTTGLEFAFSRRGAGEGRGDGDREGGARFVASSLATAWTANGLAENVIGGVLQGRKQTDPRGGSALCRKRMWALAAEVARLSGVEGAAPEDGLYKDLKGGKVLADRRQVKEDLRAGALKGWVRNTGDDGFGLAV